MDNMFKKDNFIRADFDTKQKRQSIFVVCFLCLLFIASSFAFINALYCFVDAIGSIVSGSADVAIKDLLRSIPVFLCLFMSIWTMLLLHAHYRNASEERRVKSLYKNGIAILCFAGLDILYVLIGLAVGKFASLVEGGPTPIYPLDSILYSLLFVVIGVLVILYAKKWQKSRPYLVPSRGPIVTKARFAYCLFVAIWMLFALYCFAAFFYALFIIDFVHQYALYGVALTLMFFLNACLFICWEFFYNALKEEKRKQFLLPLSLISLGVSIAFTAFYFVVLGSNVDAVANIGFGLLPIAFAASVNIATLILVLVPLIVSVTALIKALLLKKK